MHSSPPDPPLGEGRDVPLEEWPLLQADESPKTPDLELRVQDYLRGLRDFGVVFVELVPGSKRPTRQLEYFTGLRDRLPDGGIGKAHSWREECHGPGYLPGGDLWVLDVDGSNEVERFLSQLDKLGIDAPWVRTPSGGAHFFFRLPKEIKRAGLKNHVIHPRDENGRTVEMDFKFGPLTLLVAPGARRDGRTYEPQTDWFSPPVLDPRTVMPNLRLWHEHRAFLSDPRPACARISRACTYLQRKAPLSISGSGGRKALRGVATHLVAFLGLSPPLAVHLMTHGPRSWNCRCLAADGSLYPWSLDELYRACTDAVDGVPEAGVKLWRRTQERTRQDTILSTFLDLVCRLRGDEGPRYIRAIDLRGMYEAWSGREVTEAAFGRAARKAGLVFKLVTKSRIRAYCGLQLGEVKAVLERNPLCVSEVERIGVS